MKADEVPGAVMAALESLGVPYMLVGSLSVNLYTYPRSTQDADFLIQLEPHSITEIAQQLGDAFHLDPQLGFETVTGTMRYQLTVEGTRYKVELFLLSDDAHDQEQFGRRVHIDMAGQNIWVAAAEDVVITKLRWSKGGRRAKDMLDVQNIVASRSDRLDWAYIYRWCAVHETTGILDDVREATKRPDWLGPFY